VLDAFVAGLEGCAVIATSSDPTVTRRTQGCEAVPARDRLAVGRAALGSDLVVITATVFKALHPASQRPPNALLAQTLALATATRLRRRPLAMAGVGAGNLPTRTARALTRGIAAVAGRIDVRDEESMLILHSVGVRRRLGVAADVTWAVLVDPRHPGRDGGTARVVVTISHLAGGPWLTGALAGALGELASLGLQVVIQPWQPDSDGELARDLAQRLGDHAEIWPAPGDVAEAVTALRGSRLVIGLRFHSLVAAAVAGVPFVAVAHEPKLAGLARRLEQEQVPPTATRAELAAAAWRAMARRPPTAPAVDAERQTANRLLADLRQLAFDRAARRRGALP